MHVGDILAALALVVYPGVFGFPSGAPGSACVNMRPNHGVPEQLGFSGYRISLSDYRYHAPDLPVTVTIHGTFKGLLLQARLASGASTDAVGSFINNTDGTKMMDCSLLDDAITHSNRNNKSSFSVVWVPPSQQLGAIMFIATIVESKEVFWMNVESTEVVPDGCYDGGVFVDVGSSMPAQDGCNTCQCLSGGTFACTEMMCIPPTETTEMVSEQPDPGCPVFDCQPFFDCPRLIPNYAMINGQNCSICPLCDYNSGCPLFDCLFVDDCPRWVPNYEMINGYNCSTCSFCDYNSSANSVRYGAFMTAIIVTGLLLQLPGE